MINCIFTPHCLERLCDKSCPAYVETSYLLERNGLIGNKFVYSLPDVLIDRSTKILNDEDSLICVTCSSSYTTFQIADAVTFVAICRNWRGNRLHCNVYNLRYSKYLEDIRRSWTTRAESDDLEYNKIFVQSAKILIVSGLDYVNFGDFESQTLLSIIQDRQSSGLKTIIVIPPLHTLISTKSSAFYDALIRCLKSGYKEVVK